MLYHYPVIFALLSSTITLASASRKHSHHEQALLHIRDNSVAASLPNLVNIITANCADSCTSFTIDISDCVSNSTTDEALSQCSCGAIVLSDIKACAVCISLDSSAGSNSTLAIGYYNGFASQCTAVGLGSSSVIASTSSSSHSVAKSSSSSSSSPATTTRSTTTLKSTTTHAAGSSSATVAAASTSKAGIVVGTSDAGTLSAQRGFVAAGLLFVLVGALL